MALSRRTGRSRLTLVLLILTSITVLTLDFRGSSAVTSLRDIASKVFSPVRDAASTAFSPATNAWNGLFHYGKVEKENERLRAELDQLKGQQDANAAAAKQFDALSDLDRISQWTALPAATARVVAGPATNFEHVIEIDKGSNAGVKPGMPVVAGAGLVGRVTEVHADRSVIKLLTDPDVVVGVRLLSSGETALMHGQGDGRALVIDVGVDPKTQVPADEPVGTSGEDRAVFPAGIPIGTVSKAELAPAQLTQILTVTPSVDLTRLTFVRVLLWEPPS